MGVNSRDDFSKEIKRVLQERVGNRCSNPSCRCLTSGPNFDENKASRIGVAAHITAASPGGPRYEEAVSPEQRRSIQNGIWLCQNCAKRIDADPKNHSITLLFSWKSHAEEIARLALAGLPIPPNLESEGYFCPFCDTFVKKGRTVCLGCKAEVAYGATRSEWNNDYKAGVIFAVMGASFILFFLPLFLSSQLGWELQPFWGLSIPLSLALSALAAPFLGHYVASKNDTEKRQLPPRFIRKTLI